MNKLEVINKVSRITWLFWFMKIVATTLGETLGDFLSMTLGLGYMIGIAITLSLFSILIVFQLNLKRFIPLVYWLVIIATTTLGTEISDYLDRSLGLGYSLGSSILFCCLICTLIIWRLKFKNLSVYPISDRLKEMYYWMAILFSNCLGTAFGDYLGDNLGLSYLWGAAITGCIILIVIGLHYFTQLNQIVLFWIAFIFTRPFGATFGDLLTKPISKGGLNFGTAQASLIAILIMGILIYYSNQMNQKEEQRTI